LRDLRVSVSRDGGLWTARAPVVPAVCGADGTARAAFLAALVDVAAGRTGAGLGSPGSAVTQQLELHVLRPAAAGDEICASVRVVRDGRSLIHCDISLCDAAGRPAARASMTSAKIRRPPSLDPAEGRSGDWLDLALPGSGLTIPLAEYAGLRPDGEGALEFDLAPQLANGLRILHGASQALALEAAAECAAPRGAVVRDLALHFLAPGRKGPFRAHAELLRQDGERGLLRAELVDRGTAGALVALAWASIELA
jgi:acyl-coenzyme A thioesterase PaaI-like protein